MKKPFYLAFVTLNFLLIGFSCTDPDPDVIVNRYCSFYRPDYATINIELECKYFDNAPPQQTAVIKIFNWSPDGKLTVNDLDGGKLMINGYETEFRDSLGVEGFYLKNRNFKLTPGNDYTVTFEHDSSMYEFETTLPQQFDDFGIPDVVNTASNLHLQLNNGNNYYNLTNIYLVAHNPTNPGDSLLLINNEVYSGDNISVPFPIMAHALNGWEAELYVRRIAGGTYDLRFIHDSGITGTCSFYKTFNLTYSKNN
jgi:hypothetical protein